MRFFSKSGRSSLSATAAIVCMTGLVLTGAGSVSAQPIEDTLAAAYRNNPLLQAERARQRATDETIAQALSGWRPTVSVRESTWVAVRSAEPREEGRRRFAHTAPWFIRVGGALPRPRKEEVEYFVEQVSAELERNRGVVSAEALAEFEEARNVYRAFLDRAR